MFFKIKKLFKQNNNIQIVLTRYFLYGLGLIDILFLPKLLPPQVYAGIEYYKNIIFLFPNILLGASSGYIYAFYVDKRDDFDPFFKISIFISIIAAIIVGLVWNYYLLIIPLITINIFTIFEQKLKVTRNFIEAFLFKPLLSITALCICLLGVSIDEKSIVCLIFTITCLIWLFFVSKKIDIPFTLPSKEDYYVFINLIKKSISITLCSLVLSLLLFSERFFIELFYNNQLPSYSFAFNLSQIIVILISVFSYISTVELGENIDFLKKTDLLKSLKKSILLYSVFFLMYVIVIYFIAQFYSNFDNILLITSIIAFAKGFNALVGMFSPIAVYKDYNTRMLATIVIISIVNISISTFLAYHGTALITILIIDCIFILIYSLYILDIIFRRISYK